MLTEREAAIIAAKKMRELYSESELKKCGVTYGVTDGIYTLMAGMSGKSDEEGNSKQGRPPVIDERVPWAKMKIIRVSLAQGTVTVEELENWCVLDGL